MVGSVKFNLLASGLPTATTISIDIGDDGITDRTQAVGKGSSTPSLELADAFNDYWASHGAPSTGTIDIPVRVTTGNAGQLLITNLQIASAASSLRSIRIAARWSANSWLTLLLEALVRWWLRSTSATMAVSIGQRRAASCPQTLVDRRS